MNDRIAILLPCFNEEAAIGQTIGEFHAALPNAVIYVFDNHSTDRTREVAEAQGATVFQEMHLGKGHVIRRMFADVEADIYVLADGDAAHDASAAPEMIERLREENLDMVVGARDFTKTGHRFGHLWGNQIFNKIVGMLFGKKFTDIFSGYRVLSRRLVKSFPALATGFEIEAELSIHVLELRLPATEISTCARPRLEGSYSKLKTVRHGLIILTRIVGLFMQIKPFVFFGVITAALFILGLISGYPAIAVFLETGLVPYLPRAVLAASLMILASLSLACGLILYHVSQARLESRHLHYLKMKNKILARQDPGAVSSWEMKK